MPAIWTNAQLTQWTNDAVGQIATDVRCIWAREAIAITQGISLITLPAYVRTLCRVQWRGRTLDCLSWEELTMVTPATVVLSAGNASNVEGVQSKPLYYAMHPTNPYDIRVYPSPNESFSPSGINPYAPQFNTASCIIDYWREPDTAQSTLNIPKYILRRTQKAWILLKAFSSEGKGQDSRGAKYYRMKYDFLISQFRAINEGCYVGKKYSIDDGMLSVDGFRYPRPMLPPQFERVHF